MARLKFDGSYWIDILDTDSYKLSHYKLYPPNTTWMQSHLVARGNGEPTVFAGLQYIIKSQLQPLLLSSDLAGVSTFCKEHGLPFNFAGWKRIFDDLGYFPVKIRAVPEGTLVKRGEPYLTVESTDEESFWLVSWLETMLVRLWYPINVATRAYRIRKMIAEHMEATSDNPEAIWFKLHDFGSRGSSSRESAAIASMAHLFSFKGTDTMAGLLYAAEYYNEPMAGYSIPATEHSTITMWGRDGEHDAYINLVDTYGGDYPLIACVSDSYDLFEAIDRYWCGNLLENIQASGSTIVIRPDSGDPVTVCLAVVERLAEKWGTETNLKGYKILHPYIRVIYGDGINEDTINGILTMLSSHGYSADNVTFGMGGALVQQHNRDTHRIAYKCNAARVDGKLVDVYKDPATDPGKASIRGPIDSPAYRTVFENGRLLIDESLAEIRARLWTSGN